MNRNFLLFASLPVSLILFLLASCAPKGNQHANTLFEFIPPADSRVMFNNALSETDSFNYFLFSYIYMGGGVTAGDFNADGLTDLYFTANMEPNHLYLNKGGLKFEEHGEISGTAGDSRWMLGSSLCDINNDGLHDIYVCVSGLLGNRENLLYVNKGVNAEGIPIFKEEAKKYGIADPGLSTQAVFFDYDRDGDLDLYVANYPITHFKAPPFFYRQSMRNVKWEDSDHLYRNNSDGSFSDVTEESGLLSFGLTLSATVSDLNLDGYKDIYISNDFTSPDFFFMNNGDGTFSDRCGEMAGQTSFYGMGADIADYNNDGLPDIIQIDMAPEDNKRAKENMTGMRVDDFNEMVEQGLHHQYRYSTLFLNRGMHKDHLPHFSNAAWIAGVTSTDWSWAGLFADLDLDGWKDLFITNGSRRDINNKDYFDKMQKEVYFDAGLSRDELLDQIEHMPQKALPNYLYKNNADLSFSHVNQQWGMEEESFSNGAVYADLDNDGDLELVVNNIDQNAQIYRNYARESGAGNYLKIDFRGPATNKMGIGSRVKIWAEGNMQVAELTLTRGYQSSVEPILYFGLGQSESLDSLLVIWSDQQTQTLKDVGANQVLTLHHSRSNPGITALLSSESLFKDISDEAGLEFRHKENDHDGRDKQVLLPHSLSMLGPALSAGDVNNDGRDDFFIGNASGSTGSLYLQLSDGSFSHIQGPWKEDSIREDAGSAFFDANGDGLQDLYLVSGGNEFPQESSGYQDRLYINLGKGTFTEAPLPEIRNSGSCVLPFDMDMDGDMDLFIGGRQVPGNYPYPAASLILENRSDEHQVLFENVTAQVAPALKKAGMVCTAVAEDVDNNGLTDIILAGEWMPITIYLNRGNSFERKVVPGSRGWWFSIKGGDFDKDGDIDLVAGNLGLNTRYQTGKEGTFDVYAADFDGNGRSDIVLSYLQNGKQYPLRGRECFVDQNLGIAVKFPSCASFGEATVEDIYTKKALKSALHLQADYFASAYLENSGDGNFSLRPFPNEAQLSPITGMVIEDFDADGHLDILAAGNMHRVEVVTPRFDGGVGIFLKGKGNGSFEAVPAQKTGFFAPGDVKSLAALNASRGEGMILVGNNNEKLKIFKWEK